MHNQRSANMSVQLFRFLSVAAPRCAPAAVAAPRAFFSNAIPVGWRRSGDLSARFLVITEMLSD